MKQKIIVPVDSSEHSIRAIEFAMSMCNQVNGEIVLVNIQPNYFTTPNVHRLVSKKDIEEYIQESSQQVLNKALESLTNTDLIGEKLTRVGDPKLEITNLAKEYNAYSIVMGSRGLGPIKGAVLGSVSTGVLQLAPCPVVIVP